MNHRIGAKNAADAVILIAYDYFPNISVAFARF